MPTKTKEANRTKQAEWVAGVGEPTRIKILTYLASGPMTVGAIAKECGSEIVNVSHHLSVMRRCNLVECERDGRFMKYKLIEGRVVDGDLVLDHESGIQVTIPLS